MSERSRFWRSNRWREALRPDSDLAQAEGLAAGTGLLTGTVAKKTAAVGKVVPPSSHCPTCGGTSEIVVVDLVAEATTLRCRSCGRRWTSPS
ncbi:MAG: hypothetical protein U0P45_16035 [Acidimicrobiales bacterium]